MSLAYSTTLRCDTLGCRGAVVIAVTTVEEARAKAADRHHWSHSGGRDQCGPCTRGDGPSAGPRSVSCPDCLAQPDTACRSQKTGREMLTHHRARREAPR